MTYLLQELAAAYPPARHKSVLYPLVKTAQFRKVQGPRSGKLKGRLPQQKYTELSKTSLSIPKDGTDR
jgi:hypothetical protein